LTLLLTIRRFGGKPRCFSNLPVVEEPCPLGIVGYGGDVARLKGVVWSMMGSVEFDGSVVAMLMGE